MENYWNIPVNTTCKTYFRDPRMGLMGFSLFYAVSKCVQFRESNTMGGAGGRGVDEFLTVLANKYYSEASQIILLFDESWDISELLIKLETNTRKSFITYFLPLKTSLGLRIKSKGPDHFTQKILPKGTAFIIFVKDEKGFHNIIRLVSKYPWWNKRARITILVKEKTLEPTKGILRLMEEQKIFNAIVGTEVNARDGGAMGIPALDFGEDLDDSSGNNVALQIAALDPYPAPGMPKHFFVARWLNSGFSATLRPLFQEKIDNLRGHKLTAIVFEFPPLVMWEELTPKRFGYTGLEVQIFQELAHYINFTWNIYELKGNDRHGQDLGDGDWSGLIGEVSKGKADIGFANVFLLDGREKVVDVTAPYDQDRGCFAVPRPEALQHWLGLVLPFSWQVWVCILSTAFIAGPLFSAITRPLKMDTSITVGRGIFYALGAMVSSRKPPKAKSSALRSLIVAWLVFCWLACILYRVALIVSLTTGPIDYRIDTLEQLARSGLRWGGFEEVLRTFSNTTDRTDKSLFKRFQPQEDIRRALDRVATKADFAVMDSSKYLQFAAKGIYYDGYSSAIHVTKECPTSYNVGFVLPIGSPFLERINQLTRLMQNAGLIQKWLDDITYRALLKNPNKKRKGRVQGPLGLGHLKLCFVLCAGGFGCGFMSFLIENLMAWRENRGLRILNRAERKEKRRVRDEVRKRRVVVAGLARKEEEAKKGRASKNNKLEVKIDRKDSRTSEVSSTCSATLTMDDEDDGEQSPSPSILVTDTEDDKP